MPVQIIEDSQWHPGANSVDDPGKLRAGEYQWAQNVVNTSGLISTRQGVNQLAFITGQPPRGAVAFTDVNGNEYIIAAIGQSIYSLIYPFTGVWTIIGGLSVPTAARRVHMEVGIQAFTSVLGIAMDRFYDGVTNTDTSFVSASANFTVDDVGLLIQAATIPVGTTILTVTNSTTVVLSAATTGTATLTQFVIQGRGGRNVTNTLLAQPKPILIIQDGTTRAQTWDGTTATSYDFGDQTFVDGVTNTDNTLTSATANFDADVDIGRPISGAGIPAGTLIQAVLSTTSVRLNKNTTATASGVTFTIENRLIGIPIGTWMRWVGNRLWLLSGKKVYASDYLNPTQFFETTVLATGGFFALPADGTGMGVTIDFKTLLAFSEQTTTAFQAGIQDRDLWATTQDFQKVLFSGIGCVSGRTFVNQYGLSWWLSHDGLIGLDNAIQTYQTSSLHTRDENMSRSKAGIHDWVDKGCGGTYGNFLFFSVPSSTLPITSTNHHTWVMNQGVVNTITRLGPPAWSSNFVGLQPEQWVTGVFHGIKRCFALSDDNIAGVQQATLWETFIGQREDAIILAGVRRAHDIPCAFETKFFGLSPSQYMRFRFAEIDLAEIEGNVHLAVYYCGRRTSYKKVLEKHIYARPKGDLTVFDPSGFISSAVPQYRTIRTVSDWWETSDLNPDIQTDRTRMIDREFSLLITWTGKLAITAVRMFVDPEGRDIEGICEPDEATDRWLDSFGHGEITTDPAPANLLTTHLTSQYLATLTPRWVEFPVFDATAGVGGGVGDVFSVDAPVFNPPAGGYASYPKIITITTTTAGASLSVTTDGSTPTPTHGLITVGTSSTTASVSAGTTLKAMAFRTGLTDSAVVSGLYTFLVVANPVFTPAGATYPVTDFPKTITISTSTGGANIRWTVDGTVPTVTTGNLISSSSGTASVPNNATLKAIAFEAGFADSGVTSQTYIGQSTVATPTLSPVGGTYPTFPLSVTITTSTAGAYIRYTLDGSTPTASVGTLINASSGAAAVSAGQTLTARAFKAAFTDSGSVSGTYQQTVVPPTVPTPTITPAGRLLTSGQTVTVTISESLIGSTIHYTIEGNSPLSSNGTFVVTASSVSFQVHQLVSQDGIVTVTTFASKAGYTDSATTSEQYDFQPANPL